MKLILDLSTGDCRWPMERDEHTGMRLFCGEPIAGIGCSYCAEHKALAYISNERPAPAVDGYAAAVTKVKPNYDAAFEALLQ